MMQPWNSPHVKEAGARSASMKDAVEVAEEVVLRLVGLHLSIGREKGLHRLPNTLPHSWRNDSPQGVEEGDTS